RRSTRWTPEGPGDHPSTRRVELLRPPVADSPTHSARVEAALQELLPQLALRGELEEEPGECGDGHQRALDHHDRPGEPLVVDGRHPPRTRDADVRGIERM